MGIRHRLRYFIRFTCGMTTQEIRGVGVLLILLVSFMGIICWRDWQAQQEQALLFEPQLFEPIYQKLPKPYIYRYNKRSYSSIDTKRDYNAFVSNERVSNARDYNARVSGKHVWVQKKDWRIDINAADSLAWVALPGIGPSYAHRILAFREKLGGFYHVKQLKEVYGMDTLWVNENSKRLLLGNGIYRPLRINQLPWQSFRHPYLPYAQAKIFLNYRKQHGVIHDVGELRAIALLDWSVWERLVPYLSFEP